MEKSVIILGASSLQIPLIQFVKSKGYNVIVVSIAGDYPGFGIADKCVYCDVRDVQSILNATKNDEIIAVLTDETDIAVPAVATIANILNLSGNPTTVADIYSNKYIMRQKCKLAGVSVPSFFHASNINEVRDLIKTITFPAIIKPEDNQGSRGIHIVHDYEDIKKYYDDSIQYSRTGNVIIEEYFYGKEFVVEGFVCNGEYINWGIGERKYFAQNGGIIPSQTIFPSKLQETSIDILLEAEYRLHRYLEPTFGMIHSEYLLNEKTGEYILVETALRGGGVYISSHLVPLYTGVNNYEILFNCALGEKIALSEIPLKINRKASGYICFTLPEGEIIHISGIDKIKQMHSVVIFDTNKLVLNSHVDNMINKTHRLGPIIVKADTRELLEKEINKIQNTLDIKVKTTDGQIKNIIWE